MLNFSAFSDEFSKIAESFVRSGRRPISVDRLVERGTENQELPSHVFGEDQPTTEKTSGLSDRAKFTAGLASGVGLYHVGAKANEDRKLGKAVRLQQG